MRAARAGLKPVDATTSCRCGEFQTAPPACPARWLVSSSISCVEAWQLSTPCDMSPFSCCVAVVWKSTLVAAGPLTVDRIRNWPDELFDSVDDAEALAALPEFIESGIPLPTGWDPAWLDQPIRSWPERTAVAVMSFQVPLSRRDRVKGLLLAVPVGNVLDRPTANDVTTARPDYSRSGRFSTAAWTDAESGMVFVCLIAPGQYERLRRALVPQPV